MKKSYGSLVALDLDSLVLSEGIYGLLGPNGAGKSTLMNILTGNLAPDEGNIWCDGQPMEQQRREYRAKIGYAPQQQSLYPSFTAARFLSYMAALQGLPARDSADRISWALDQVELLPVADEPIRTFSGGMKQRLVIAQAILSDPELLILDEPTAGLDPRQRIAVRNLISRLAKDKTVLIATHVVSDVEHVAKELILLNHGVVLRKGTPQDLNREIDSCVFEIQASAEQWEELKDTCLVVSVYEQDHVVHARILSRVPPETCRAQGIEPNLEDVYLWHFGDEIHAFG